MAFMAINIVFLFINTAILIVIGRAFQKLRISDSNDLQENIEGFVSQVERENEILYEKVVSHIKEKEIELDKKIKHLEEILENNPELKVLNGDKESEEQPEATKTIPFGAVKVDQSGHEKIVTLHKQGFNANQIAKVLKIQQGEVELIINMTEQQKQAK